MSSRDVFCAGQIFGDLNFLLTNTRFSAPQDLEMALTSGDLH